MENSNDSKELLALRIRCKDADRWDGGRLTAFRLGIYAGEEDVEITSFGMHSRRWQENFELGRKYGIERRAKHPDRTGPAEATALKKTLRRRFGDAGVHALTNYPNAFRRSPAHKLAHDAAGSD